MPARSAKPIKTVQVQPNSQRHETRQHQAEKKVEAKKHTHARHLEWVPDCRKK